MDRRSFLQALLGASVVTAAPKVVYCFAPPRGWRSRQISLEALMRSFRTELAYAAGIPAERIFDTVPQHLLGLAAFSGSPFTLRWTKGAQHAQ